MVFLLHHLLQRAAQQTPDAEAFRCLKRSLTYAELELASGRLCSALQGHGIRRGDRVGIYLNKSLECAIAIYGILKSGAAYVPLDPGAPLARLDLIIRDCGIRCLISEDAKREELLRLGGLAASPLQALIGLSEPLPLPLEQQSWAEVASAAPGLKPLEQGRTAEDPAYIMYTSGSTGTPKGIIHSHHSGLSYACMAVDLYRIRADDRLSNLPPLHFDQSIFDYFSGVAAGACTVIIPEAYAKLPASLSELMQRERLTVWYSVPFALIQLLLHGVLAQRDLRSLRLVMFGGEPFPAKYLAGLMRQWPQAEFCNVYGPAEVNQCTYHMIARPAAGDLAPPAIGVGCPNVELLVVDEQDGEVPSGTTGELLVRSPTMMRGYHGRPALNERAFFYRSNADGTRDTFYRTGDLVRQDTRGQLHFHGRKDRQVKLRGFRIELDEIEAVLADHPAVEEAACVLTGDAVDERRLHASVTLNDNAICDAAALRLYAMEQLQRHAVPEQIDILPAFPRTSSGKIDRQRLLDVHEHGAAGRERAG